MSIDPSTIKPGGKCQVHVCRRDDPWAKDPRCGKKSKDTN